MSEDGDSWGDYDSAFMFPSEDEPCTCDHEPVEHGYGGCEVEGCPCLAYWGHT